jgi:ferredoxin
MSYAVAPACIGCGVCEFACPRGAITQDGGFPVVYRVDPLACNDCDRCAPLCPVAALGPVADVAACHGRGCPLSTRRYDGYECTEGDPTLACATCGSPLWRAPGGAWWCPACRRRADGGGAVCPKPGQVARRAGLGSIRAGRAAS